MTTMTKRLAVLEKARPSAVQRRVIRLVVEGDKGETKEAAIARWCTENPDQPPPAEPDLIILRTVVSAPRREASLDTRDEQQSREERGDHEQ